MKEFKVLGTIVALVLVMYYGIEPYAHHVMHPEPAPADYKFSDLKNVDTSLKGDVANGKDLVAANCTACHSMESEGFPKLMPDADSAAAYGVVPPDISTSGKIYETNYLANFIFDPATASNLGHKYTPESGKMHPMPAYNWMSAQEIMDMVAYLQDAASKVKVEGDAKAQHKAVFKDACGRCHSMGYAGIDALTPPDTLKAYMGASAPDLSQYIKSRGRHYLENFINNPQILLHGTSMPRVGLTKKAQIDVIDYMEEIGDAKKPDRDSLGWKVMLYMLVFALLALAWKKQIWKEVH
ncbi:MAG: c-type cytochrome [Campylobacterota bacterium]|nr:c-type cytochrome [Campylobacterota bacterium]